MNYYLEITMLPDPEFKKEVLMNAMFAKLHRTLAALNSTNIGISFPDFEKKSLGSRLRVHGTQMALDNLMAQKWLQGLQDYTQQTKVQPVPEHNGYLVVKRVQAKSNIERLRRRSVAKGWLTIEEAIQKISLEKQQALNLPFIQLKSLSTSQTFRLFIQHGKVQDKPEPGQFNTYGLSLSATIPWF